MIEWPDKEDLEGALKAAAAAHHDFETNFLSGVHDEQWAGWYAAYVLGRLGDFTSPTNLAKLLMESPSVENWTHAAAGHVKVGNPASQ